MRLIDRTDVNEHGCWVSSLGIGTQGYSQVSIGKRRENGNYILVNAHVLAYEALVGPIPEGCELDHLCRNRACWKPSHLEPVSHGENVRRGAGAAFQRDKTHCPRGHEYSVENTFMRPQRSGGGNSRECRQCIREREREYRMRPERRSHLIRDDRHGTILNYQYGCRCDPCKAVAAEDRRRRREVIGTAHLIRDDRHGTYNNYAYGCRCDQCRTAGAAYRRRLKVGA